jgi:hypothetical protein
LNLPFDFKQQLPLLLVPDDKGRFHIDMYGTLE